MPCGSKPFDGVPQLHINTNNLYDAFTSKGEGTQDSERVSPLETEDTTNSQGPVPPSDSSSSSLLQRPAMPRAQSAEGIELIRISSDPRRRLLSQPSNVGERSTCLEWQAHSPSNSEYYVDFRRIHIRLESELWGPTDRRSLDLRGDSGAYKCPGAESCFSCPPNIYVSKVRDQHILLLIDNSTSTAYLNYKGGTTSHKFSDLAVEIWAWCLQREITLRAEHIPGRLNERADLESKRCLDSSDWQLDPSLFLNLMERWGPCDVDLFTARHNTQLPRYFSFKPDPKAEAINALAQDWRHLNPYAFPSFILIGRVLNEVRSSRESNSGNYSMANTDLVSDHPGVECGRIVSLSKAPNSTNQPQRATPLPVGDPTVGCLESFRKRLGEAVPEEVFTLLCASWRKGTEKSYSAAWNQWLEWCRQQGGNPLTPSIN